MAAEIEASATVLRECLIVSLQVGCSRGWLLGSHWEDTMIFKEMRPKQWKLRTQAFSSNMYLVFGEEKQPKL